MGHRSLSYTNEIYRLHVLCIDFCHVILLMVSWLRVSEHEVIVDERVIVNRRPSVIIIHISSKRLLKLFFENLNLLNHI